MSEQARRRIVISPGQELVIQAAGPPTGDPLAAVLKAIQALGHHRISLDQIDDDRWCCGSYLPTSDREPDETDVKWVDRIEAGGGYGDTPLEAAMSRLAEVRKLAAKRKETP